MRAFLYGDLSSCFQAATWRQAGMNTTNDSGPGARSSRYSMCSAISVMSSGTNGGLAWKDPDVGTKSKKLPRLPNGPSVSANAEQ